MKYGIVLLCAFVLFCSAFSGCVKNEPERGNQAASKTTSTIVTSTSAQQSVVTYTAEQMEKLNLRIIHYHNISFETYKQNYQAVCTRETFCGFYDILLQEDGRRAFVFYDKDYRLYRLLSLEPVKTKQEMEDALSKLTSYEQILDVDGNCWFTGSGMVCSIHVVKEGFFVLDSYGLLGTEAPFIAEYYSNEEVENDSEKHYNLPYILESDRVW